MKEVIRPTKPHKHADYFEIIILDEGSGIHVIDDVRYPVEVPVIYFLRPNQTHCWDFSSIPKGFVLLFKEEIFLNESAKDLIHNVPPVINLHDNQFIGALVKHLNDFHMPNDIIASHLNIIINYLHRHIHKGSVVHNNRITSQYKSLVNEQFMTLRKVSDYAGILNITAHKLNEECRKNLHRNAYDLIRERIFLEAKTQLIHTQKNINQISAELDFTDASHFSKFFKAQAKITPGKFRQLLKY